MLPLLALLAAPPSTPAVPMEIHGEVRMRAETLANLDFDEALDSGPLGGDGERFLLRSRLGVEGRPTDLFKVYVQIQDSRLFGQEATTATNTQNLDLHQGWLEIEAPEDVPLSLRVGRMELSYGDQRLIGAFNWDNVGRAFDGAVARWNPGAFRLDAFWTRLHVDPKSEFARALGDDFMGLYGTFSSEKLTIDAYVLGLYDRGGRIVDDEGVAQLRFPGGGEMRLYTPGVRVDAKPLPGFRFNGEAALQFGKRGDLDIQAWAFHVAADWTASVAMSPKILVGYNRASGDSDPNDGEWGTFENLFPTNHDKYGLIDLAAWKNLSDFYVGAAFQPVEPVVLAATVHWLARANDGDTFYRANGTPLRPLAVARTTDAMKVGTELDLTANWAMGKGLGTLLGWSKIWAGDFMDATTPGGEAANPGFGYLQLTGAF